MPTPLNNVAVNVPEVDHAPDKIGGPVTKAMAGRTFEYKYPTGLDYKISFNDTHVYFSVPKLLDGSIVIALPYRERMIRDDIYLVHWLGPGRTSHISLVFDLKEGKVDAAALMPGMFELFDRAVLGKSWENGENALY